MRPLILGFLLFGLAACTPAHLTKLPAPTSESSELIIYREAAFNAGGAKLVFGANDSDYASLWNEQYTKTLIQPGSYKFYVRSTGADQPFIIPITIEPRKRLCLKAFPNPVNIAKVFFFPAYYFGNTFLLEQVNCLSVTELSQYSLVEVAYTSESK